MFEPPQNNPNCSNLEGFGTDTSGGYDATNMTKAERKQVVLDFLAEHRLALPPAVLHRNLKLHQRLFVSASTLENYLDEMVEEGWVVRVRPEPLTNQEIVKVGDNESVQAYYLITEEGRERANDLDLELSG